MTPPHLPHRPSGPRRDVAVTRSAAVSTLAVAVLSLTIGFWLGVIFHAAIL